MVSKKLRPIENIDIHNIKTVSMILNVLQREIGLTDDEIIIVIYTSIDHDYFTNLILLQAEFLKWFITNFEGESRDEIDFLENKNDIWIATQTYAMEVLSWQGRLTENH